MSKLAHSNQETMDEIETSRLREDGFSEAEIKELKEAAMTTPQRAHTPGEMVDSTSYELPINSPQELAEACQPQYPKWTEAQILVNKMWFLREEAKDPRMIGPPAREKTFKRIGEKIIEKAFGERDAERDRLKELVERIKLEAQGHAGEAKGANATLNEIYQLCSGATGEKANWNGARPVADELSRLKEQNAALVEAVEAVQKGFQDGSIKWTKPRRSEADPYHPANTLMCAALSLVREGK